MAYNLPKSVVGTSTVSFVNSASPVSLTSATPANITSISLPAGTYSISCIINFTGSGTVGGFFGQLASISTTSATLGNNGDNMANAFWPTTSFGGLADLSVSVPSYILTIGITTTVYLVAQISYISGPFSAYGRISAVRIA